MVMASQKVDVCQRRVEMLPSCTKLRTMSICCGTLIGSSTSHICLEGRARQAMQQAQQFGLNGMHKAAIWQHVHMASIGIRAPKVTMQSWLEHAQSELPDSRGASNTRLLQSSAPAWRLTCFR